MPTPTNELNALVETIVAYDQWIIDGNYGSTMDLRLQRADTIIYLDFPTYLCLFRVIKRRIQYRGTTRPDMGKGCEEKIDWPFLKWILNFRRTQRPGIIEKLNRYKDEKDIYIIKSSKQLEEFVHKLF